MKYRLIILPLVLSLMAPVCAADAIPFQREDVFELEWVSDPQISPDGSRVVYVRNGMDIMSDSRSGRLWLVDSDGSDGIPLTGRDVSERNPVWSPDGTRVAFSSQTENVPD